MDNIHRYETERMTDMFREMRRFKQQISREECIRILKEQPRGVLSVLGDDDYPYGVPLDHWYCEENGRLYFHCAKTGHKLDAVRKHDKASYCVLDAEDRHRPVPEVHRRRGVPAERAGERPAPGQLPGTDPRAHDRKARQRILKRPRAVFLSGGMCYGTV